MQQNLLSVLPTTSPPQVGQGACLKVVICNMVSYFIPLNYEKRQISSKFKLEKMKVSHSIWNFSHLMKFIYA